MAVCILVKSFSWVIFKSHKNAADKVIPRYDGEAEPTNKKPKTKNNASSCGRFTTKGSRDVKERNKIPCIIPGIASVPVPSFSLSSSISISFSLSFSFSCGYLAETQVIDNASWLWIRCGLSSRQSHYRICVSLYLRHTLFFAFDFVAVGLPTWAFSLAAEKWFVWKLPDFPAHLSIEPASTAQHPLASIRHSISRDLSADFLNNCGHCARVLVRNCLPAVAVIQSCGPLCCHHI